jgi:hypothetical protein
MQFNPAHVVLSICFNDIIIDTQYLHQGERQLSGATQSDHEKHTVLAFRQGFVEAIDKQTLF